MTIKQWAVVLASVMFVAGSVSTFFVFRGATEGVAAILAYLPVALVSVMVPFAARLESDAQAEKAAEASVKCLAVALFGVALGTTLVITPLPVAASGTSWFVMCVVGVTCWSLAVEVGMILFWHGQSTWLIEQGADTADE